jgi:hypothetical protein
LTISLSPWIGNERSPMIFRDARDLLPYQEDPTRGADPGADDGRDHRRAQARITPTLDVRDPHAPTRGVGHPRDHAPARGVNHGPPDPHAPTRGVGRPRDHAPARGVNHGPPDPHAPTRGVGRPRDHAPARGVNHEPPVLHTPTRGVGRPRDHAPARGVNHGPPVLHTPDEGVHPLEDARQKIGQCVPPLPPVCSPYTRQAIWTVRAMEKSQTTCLSSSPRRTGRTGSSLKTVRIMLNRSSPLTTKRRS